MSQINPEFKLFKGPAFLAKVAEARRMSIGEKLAAGPRLFDQRCLVMRDEVRIAFPDYTAHEVDVELRRLLAIERRGSEGDIFRDAGMIDE